MVVTENPRSSRNPIQVTRQKPKALLGVHRMAVEANSGPESLSRGSTTAGWKFLALKANPHLPSILLACWFRLDWAWHWPPSPKVVMCAC